MWELELIANDWVWYLFETVLIDSRVALSLIIVCIIKFDCFNSLGIDLGVLLDIDNFMFFSHISS